MSEIYEAYKTSSDESSFSSVKTLSSDGTSHIVNIEASFSSSEFSFAFTSYDIPYDESISSKLNNIYDNVIHLAENAVQYFLDGNSVPVTDEEKEAFNEYISKDSDGTIGNLSYSDLKTAANICNSLDEIISTVQSRSDFESLYSAINNSDFSDDLKGLFNNALYCIRIENSNIGEDNSDVEERIQELLEQRELMKLEMQKAQADSSISGEEKYSMYIKNAKQNTAIDSSLDDIINEIINYYNDEQ